MTGYYNLTRRNCKLFFKDKGLFFSSLITPVILLVLYVTFLAKVYRDSFYGALPASFAVKESLIDGMVGAQLISSLLAVSCVTVAFCSNLIMIQDKVTGAYRDLTVSPVKRSVTALAYFTASAAVTLIISVTALGVSLIYLAVKGWYLSLGDVLLILLDITLLTLFGTALSSCVNFPLKTNGQASAVGTIVGAGYGFICGAYMPISNFSPALQKVLSFLPGTYGTSLLRSHSMRGVFAEMKDSGFPAETVKMIRESVDCSISFFNHNVSDTAKLLVLAGAVLLFAAVYVLLNKYCRTENR